MNFDGSITKKIYLEKNDGLSSFLNLACQQNHNVFEVFYNFISEIKPKQILEIGTALGGFTSFLNKIIKELNLDTKILSYDIREMTWYKDIVNENLEIKIKDVFSSNYSTVEQEVIDFIQQEGTTIVLCDGGNKVGEFNILSNYLKSGDFILAHDYAENREIFENEINKKVWNWFEISYDNIKEACINNNLIEYKKDIFKNVVWTCRQKK
jgi:cephalosporin hydroxylase